MNLDPNILIQTLLNRVSEQAIRIVQLEAAVEQLSQPESQPEVDEDSEPSE